MGRRPAGARAAFTTAVSTERPEVIFEFATVPASSTRKLLVHSRPTVARAQCLAAIHCWGEFEKQQRCAPLETLNRHLAQPVARAGRGAGGAVLALPEGLRRFMAGAVAGALAKTGTAPLEKLRMSLMTSSTAQPLQIIADTWRQGGVTAFFGGNAVDVLRVMPSKAIELAAFDGFKRLFARVPLSLPHEGGPNYRLQSVPQQDRTVGPSATMMAGALAGLASTVACFPLETVRTRLAVEPGAYRGIWDCLSVLTRTSGFGGLYKGISASAVGAVPYSALRFGAFDGLKHIYRKKHGRDIPPAVLVAAGALAGLAASTATFPLEVVRRRMMAGAPYNSVIEALTTIAHKEGWPALYRGLGVSCIKQAPQTGLTLFAYDTCKKLLDLDK